MLIRPQASFVIKSSLASKTDKKFAQALYINICHHELVEKPSIRTSEQGRSWMVPYFIGKTRYDQEESGTIVNTVDVVFHQESIEKAKSHTEYHRLVAPFDQVMRHGSRRLPDHHVGEKGRRQPRLRGPSQHEV